MPGANAAPKAGSPPTAPAAGARSPRGPRLDSRGWGPSGARTALPPLPPPPLCSESPVGPPRPPRGPPPAFLPASPSCGAAASSIIDARPRLTSASGLPSARSPARPSRLPPPAPSPAARFLYDCHKGKQRRSSSRWGPADATAPRAGTEGRRKGSRACARSSSQESLGPQETTGCREGMLLLSYAGPCGPHLCAPRDCIFNSYGRCCNFNPWKAASGWLAHWLSVPRCHAP